ncbi:MAG: signal peptide peptidase SppA [Mesorhizobium sp.]|nr:signal peptide peptidase SppA [Mesorhizobium sp.]
MASKADDMIDRRRLRRKLTFWRGAAIVIAAVAVIAAAVWMFQDTATSTSHIAKIRIEGTITDNRELQERIQRIGESASVQGVIVAISSPGGTTTGGEAIFEALRTLSEQKPMVAEVGTLAASAGYMIATASDHIVARQSSIVGSIGVLVQFPDVTELMENIGVSYEAVKSSPLKAEPNPFTPTTDEEREMLRALVMDSYDWFVDLVTDRRALTRQQVLALADGSIFTGRQALERGLVDALGGEEVAKAWLVEQGIDADLEVVEWRDRSSSDGLFGIPGIGTLAAWALGFADAEHMMARFGMDRIFLDGLVSVWQPDLGRIAE